MTEERASSWERGAWEPERLAVVRTGRVTARPSPRVYTRRRIVFAVILTVLVLAAWFAMRELGSIAALPTPEVTSQPMTRISAPSYVAQPGDTYWTIARRLDPDGDPRPLVDRLVASNGGTALQAGDVIVVPAVARS
ncbi:MAG TPA: LysM peptidoglycan-binding domain-containing protein [Acidimicrobiales bacterium]|nr:LysM peptidoglycan-binding domain-containing protein [Acidimicrobiales bacterium]